MRRDTLLAAFAALALLAAPAGGEPREIEARVVWSDPVHAYVAASDTSALVAGARLTFLDRRRIVAAGEVQQVMDHRIASVRLTQGSLAGVRHPDRLRVQAEPPAVRGAPRLRVGIPAGTRENLSVICDAPGVNWPGGPGAYDVVPLTNDRWLALRNAFLADPAWPETLEVRSFGDATDEEIALQRGELDAAVFWPGEISARLREHPGTFRLIRARRSRGVLATIDASAPPRDTLDPGPAAKLAGMNRDLFGGDLLAWTDRGGVADTSAGRSPAAAPAPRPFTVDPALAGRTDLEQYLNGGATLFPRGKPAPIRLTLLDVPLADVESLDEGWRARGITTRFALRCPVLITPAAEAELPARDPSWLADLPGCHGGNQRP